MFHSLFAFCCAMRAFRGFLLWSMLVCLAVQRTFPSTASPIDPITVRIDDFIGSQIIGHIENSEIARISFYMGSVDSEDITHVTERATYLFDISQGSQFRITIDLQQYLKSPTIFVIAQDMVSLERTILKYSIDPELYRCDENLLEIKRIKDLKDSCAEITVLYNGVGDVFVLGASAVEETPETKTIISDGIYLGKFGLSCLPSELGTTIRRFPL